MYGKLFRQMYRGTLASVGPWEVLVTFQQLIILADADGVVDMTPDAIARETTIPIEIIEKGIAALLEPDKYSRSPEEDGRRIIPLDERRPWGWRIVNYQHYRSLQNEMERREYHRKYWHKRKDKLNNSTNTQINSTDSTDSTDEEEEGKRNKRRATRIPSDFGMTPEREAAAKAENLDPHRTLQNFRDHWLAAPGQKGVKLDWEATWRKWCRSPYNEKQKVKQQWM